MVAEVADVRRLLDRVIELSLGRYLAAGKSAGDGHYILKPGEELLRFPLKRFFGASAVLQFAAAAGAESFSARCGVAFAASSLRIQLRREFRELPYHGLVSVNVDQLRDNGTPLLSRLALASGSGVYRISLPLGAEVGLALCEALRTFLESRMAGAGLTGSSQSAAEPGEVDAGGHD
ncbi:MAG TPA: hypothetical protein VJ417_01695 [Candidatus Glassbacteria bacterium]|nr:hypothetical protein [Candidatus Glassbacteria bacterium]